MQPKFWIRGAYGASGPFDAQQIRGLVKGGQLTRDMSISRDGLVWQIAGKTEGLFPAADPDAIADFAADTGVQPSAQSPDPASAAHAAPALGNSESRPLNANGTTEGGRDPGLLSRLINLKTFWLYFLFLATYGIYVVIWLYRNSRIIEQVTRTKLVSDRYILWMAFLTACVVGNQTLATQALSYATEDNTGAFVVCNVARIALGVMIVVWAYKAKAALEIYAFKDLGIRLQLNSAWTFLLNIFYINYCINDLTRASASADEDGRKK